ncbi:hypothetical protein GCM10007916_34320 [Psychromonas marina]|uniref:DUF3014 domain-containing protein n=1 Tax=Psychromonas marina TaxID=88364 RepID=A0ABQ6E4U6_9GAMM|nr:DUF3014 domain-containing protein [Psychromonas marina]GLS92361.1 hypothetical protein GCM10007916_34320 [Psychromonas marina]
MTIEKRSDNKLLKVIIVSVGVVLIGGGLGPYLIDHFSEADVVEDNKQVSHSDEISAISNVDQQPQKLAQVVTIKPPTPQTNTTTENAEPLPALHESDPFVLQNIKVVGDTSLIVQNDIISNVVVFIDNFSRGELVTSFSPLLTPSEPFSIKEVKNILIMDSKSYQRYDNYAQLVDNIDVENFISLYSQLTPLIDQAYQDIGYEKGSFQDTFNKAITEVLDTPIIRYNIELNSPSVIYKYADENLETLPDTQKLMLRMGPDNLQKIQLKLAQIQNELEQL